MIQIHKPVTTVKPTHCFVYTAECLFLPKSGVLLAISLTIYGIESFAP